MTGAGHQAARAGRIATGAAIAALALLVGPLPASASASTVPSITEFPIAGSANPDLIAPGLPTDPAASVWVTDPYGGAATAGEVYRVDTATGTVSGTFAPAAGATVPGFIIRGPDNRMWTTDADGTMLRAGSDGAFEAVSPTGGARGGLTVGPDGNVWYLNRSGPNNGQVGFINPTTLDSSQFDIPTANSHPEEITPGPPSDPSSMWFTEEDTDRIGRVDTTTHQVTDYGGLSAGAKPNGIVVGSDGALWFAEYGIGKIGRIDPATHQVTEYAVPGELGGPDRMTVAPGGRIWFTLLDGSQIGSFLPGPNPTFDLIPTPTAGAGPSGITIGPDGHVWFAEYNNHAVGRIDGGYSQLPHTTIDSGPSGTITIPSPTFAFHADDPAATFECSLDGGPFAACASPDTIGPLPVGDHTFTVRAVNGAGTETSPPSRTWTVAPPPAGPPVNTGRPAIIQAFDCGATLGGGCKAIPNTYDCDPGTWDGADPGIPYTYEWQRLTPDNSYISGYRVDTVATGQRFYAQESPTLIVAATESWRFQCVVTTRNAAGASSATSLSAILNPAPAPPLPSLNPTVDIRVTGIEVTQGVQTDCCAPGTLPRRFYEPNPTTRGMVDYQGVKLAAGKYTVVRVFAGFTQPAGLATLTGATATLRVYDSSGTLLSTLPADSSPASIGRDNCLCVTRAQRASPGASFNFLIPWQETVHQALSFRATVNPEVGFGLPQQCTACKANTFELDGAPFMSTALVPIHPYRLVTVAGATKMTEQQVFGSAQTVFPNDLQIYPYGLPINVENLDNAGAVAAVLDRAAKDGFTGSDYPIGVFFKGEAKLANGLTNGRVLYQQDGPISIVEDTRPITSVAHEIGHGLGLLHADTGSSSPTCPPVPLHTDNCGPHPDGTADCGGNSNGQKGETWPQQAPLDNEGRLDSFGLDRRNWNTLQAGSLPQTFVEGYGHDGSSQPGAVYYDFMSYCPAGGVSENSDWISARNWNRLVNFHPPAQNLPAAADRARGAATGPRLRVIATVDPAGAVSIFDIEPGATAGVGSTPGSPYRIELRDKTGAVITSVTPLTTMVHVDGVPGQRPPLVLDATLPALSRTAAVVVTAAGQELARRNRSRTAPTVRILSPRRGSHVGRTATTLVRWAASDADGDRLTATVEYSPNGGHTWKVVADQVQGSAARVPSRLLSASHNGTIRVRISDGFDVAAATAGPLRTTGAPPIARIIVSVHRGTVRANQTLLLQGAAFDDAGQPLAGRRLAWYAGTRLLGHGELLTVNGLPVGATTIRLLATDRDGRTSQATLRLKVLGSPPNLLIASGPTRVAPTARRVRLIVASNTPAVLTIAGVHHLVGPRPRAITIRIRPGLTTLHIRYTLSAPGGTVHLMYTLAR